MLIRAVALFLIFVAASGVIARAQRSEQVPPRQAFSALPMTLAEWSGRVDPPLTEKELDILGADDYLLRSYYAPGMSAGLYMGYWATQKRGDAVHSPLNCLPGSGWEPLSRQTLGLTVSDRAAGARQIDVNRFVIQKGLDRQLVLYWYQSHDRVIASEYVGKFYLVADAIRLGRSDTAIVRVVVPIADSTAAAETAAERTGVQFVQRIFPLLTNHIPS
jgi:EpsI family protein